MTSIDKNQVMDVNDQQDLENKLNNVSKENTTKEEAVFREDHEESASREDIEEAESIIKKAEEQPVTESPETSSIEDSSISSTKDEFEKDSEDESQEEQSGKEALLEKSKKENQKKNVSEKKEEAEFTVFIKGFGNEATESAIENELSKYGKIKAVRIPKDRNTGKNKGFAYVDFEEEDSAKKVLKLKKLFGFDIFTDTPKPRAQKGKNSTMFVKNLPYECSEESVREYFEKFGIVTSVRLPRDENKRCKGFSFVEFLDQSVYNKVLKMSHVFDERKLLVEECLSSNSQRNNKRFRGGDGNEEEQKNSDERKKFKGRNFDNGDRKWQKKGDFNRSRDNDRSSGRRDQSSRQHDKTKGDNFKAGNSNGKNQKIVFEDNSD